MEGATVSTSAGIMPFCFPRVPAYPLLRVVQCFELSRRPRLEVSLGFKGGTPICNWRMQCIRAKV